MLCLKGATGNQSQASREWIWLTKYHQYSSWSSRSISVAFDTWLHQGSWWYSRARSQWLWYSLGKVCQIWVTLASRSEFHGRRDQSYSFPHLDFQGWLPSSPLLVVQEECQTLSQIWYQEAEVTSLVDAHTERDSSAIRATLWCLWDQRSCTLHLVYCWLLDSTSSCVVPSTRRRHLNSCCPWVLSSRHHIP